MASSRILELANLIQINTSKVDQHFSAHGIPTPSFDIDTPLELDLPNDIAACRSTIIEATEELHSLMLGPIQTVNWLRVKKKLQTFKFSWMFWLTEPVGIRVSSPASNLSVWLRLQFPGRGNHYICPNSHEMRARWIGGSASPSHGHDVPSLQRAGGRGSRPHRGNKSVGAETAVKSMDWHVARGNGEYALAGNLFSDAYGDSSPLANSHPSW